MIARKQDIRKILKCLVNKIFRVIALLPVILALLVTLFPSNYDKFPIYRM